MATATEAGRSVMPAVILVYQKYQIFVVAASLLPVYSASDLMKYFTCHSHHKLLVFMCLDLIPAVWRNKILHGNE